MNKGLTTGMFISLCLISLSGRGSDLKSQAQKIVDHQYRSDKSSDYQLSQLNTKPYEVWGLTKKDWAIYQTLMQGSRGILSPHLDPITALGVEASGEVERQRYAELHVKFEKQRVEKELAFQRSVDAAWDRLYPKAQLIDMEKIKNIQNRSSVNLTAGRLLFFTSINSCIKCEQALNVLLEQAKQGRDLDIFLLDAKNDNAIRSWAKTHQIPREKVIARSITLNHDQGRLAMISQFTGQVPYVAVKVGHNRYQEIDVH